MRKDVFDNLVAFKVGLSINSYFVFSDQNLVVPPYSYSISNQWPIVSRGWLNHSFADYWSMTSGGGVGVYLLTDQRYFPMSLVLFLILLLLIIESFTRDVSMTPSHHCQKLIFFAFDDDDMELSKRPRWNFLFNY